jgi:subtilisin family serine protease
MLAAPGMNLSFLAATVAILALSAPLSAEPSSLRRAPIHGGLPLYFAARPPADGSARMLKGMPLAPVTIRFASAPSAADVASLRALGALVPLRRDGSPRGRRTFLSARLPAGAVDRVAALARVTQVSLDGPVFAPPRPLDVTAAEIQAPDAWRTDRDGKGGYTGQGITICDIDSGIDIFHPLFFRADGGLVPWEDLDGDGVFSPGVDGVDLDGSGAPSVLRVLDSVISAFFDDKPLFDSDDPSYAIGMDWLYADDNNNGQRDHGPEQGFTEADPTYGERILIADDVNHDGVLDAGEKLVALGTSKVAMVHLDGKEFARGKNLIELPISAEFAHGSGAAAVMIGGHPGLSRLVGIAPDAELIMETSTDGTGEVALADHCIEHGARVVLHEYAPWLGYHLDGSSDMEQLIDSTSAEGVSHINPAGNLSTSQKLYKRTLAAGSEGVIPIEAPANSGYGAFRFLGVSILWRDTARHLEMALEDPTGVSQALSLSVPTQKIWQDKLFIYTAREDSSRGTARVDIYLYGPTLTPPPIPTGTWKLTVTDPAPAGAGDLDLVAYVMDDLSGWGKGIHFPEFASEEHLIGYPGTADRGLAVAAYTGHGFFGGTPGERAQYSGRGLRIDGTAILSVSAPDDPITAGACEGRPACEVVYGGTSGASPHVAGAAALLLQADPARSGLDVRAAIRAGALADEAVGSVPSTDFGYGKLRIHRSLFGSDAPNGTAPHVAVEPHAGKTGEALSVPIAVFDVDEPSGGLVIEWDRDYDGVYEARLQEQTIRTSYDAAGVFVSKVRVTDSTGRQASALGQIDVTALEPPTHPVLHASGGVGCTVGPGRPRCECGWLTAFVMLAIMRRRRARSFAPASHGGFCRVRS